MRSAHSIYRLAERVLDTAGRDWGAAMMTALTPGPQGWVSACCTKLPEDESRPPEAIQRLLGIDDARQLLWEASDLASAIRLKLDPAIRKALISLPGASAAIERHLVWAWGLALHFRFARDTSLAASWSQARAIAQAWGDIAADEETDLRLAVLEKSRWLWRCIEQGGNAGSHSTLRIGIVVVDQGGEGHVAQLSVSLIEPEAYSAGSGPSRGFVPSAGAIALVLDRPFEEAFESARTFVSGLGVWPADVAVEWGIEFMDGPKSASSASGPVIMLTGGSAGAAIGIVTAGLLCRRNQEIEAKNKTA